MKIVWITQGGEQAGVGHLYRTATLIKQLSGQANFHIQAIVPNSIKNPLPVETVSEYKQVSQLKDINVDFDPDTVVVDVPENQDEKQLTQIVQGMTPDHVVAFGSWTAEDHPEFTTIVDTKIDFSTNLATFESCRRQASGKTYLEGPRYMVLREEFRQWKNTWSPKPQPKNIIALFGGSDPQNHTLTATQCLLANSSYQITTIFGPGNPFVEEFRAELGESPRVDIVVNPASIATHLTQGDLLVTSPGLTMYEALYIGLPVVAFFQNKLQQQVYEDCQFVYPATKLRQLNTLVKQAYKRHQSKETSIDIGTGLNEILDEIIGKK